MLLYRAFISYPHAEEDETPLISYLNTMRIRENEIRLRRFAVSLYGNSSDVRSNPGNFDRNYGKPIPCNCLYNQSNLLVNCE